MSSRKWFLNYCNDKDKVFSLLYYYMKNYCNLIGSEQWHFSFIWNTYMWKLPTFWGQKYKQIMAWFVRDVWHKCHSWYFKIVSNYSNFEISLVVFMPNITTNHAITYTNFSLLSLFQIYDNTQWCAVMFYRKNTLCLSLTSIHLQAKGCDRAAD